MLLLCPSLETLLFLNFLQLLNDAYLKGRARWLEEKSKSQNKCGNRNMNQKHLSLSGNFPQRIEMVVSIKNLSEKNLKMKKSYRTSYLDVFFMKIISKCLEYSWRKIFSTKSNLSKAVPALKRYWNHSL